MKPSTDRLIRAIVEIIEDPRFHGKVVLVLDCASGGIANWEVRQTGKAEHEPDPDLLVDLKLDRCTG